MEWQTMDSAPRDGSTFLGFDAGTIAQMRCDGWKGKHPYWILDGYVWSNESYDCYPTHWMPLIEPPK